MKLSQSQREKIRRYERDDLLVLLRDILDCLKEKSPLHPEHRMEAIAMVLESLTGIDLTKMHSRSETEARARCVFCYVARQEGFTYQSIGEFLGRGHGAVYYSHKKMTAAFRMPDIYADYIELHEKLTEMI